LQVDEAELVESLTAGFCPDCRRADLYKPIAAHDRQRQISCAHCGSMFLVTPAAGAIEAAKRNSPPMVDLPFSPGERDAYARAIARPLLLGYQGMMVASMIIEQSVKQSDPTARIERHHWLTRETLDAWRACSDFETGQGIVFDCVRKQVAEAEELLGRLPGERLVYVIVGFREPLDHAISAFFQNVAFFCPRLTYAPEATEPEARRILEAFRAEFEEMRERQIKDRQPTNVREQMIDLKLGGLHRWFALEFNRFFDVNIYTTKPQPGANVIRIPHQQYEFLLYRFEGLHESLPNLLRSLPIKGDRPVVETNTAAEKKYAALYQAFKRQFVPTAEMEGYYRGDNMWGPYMSHFYSGFTPGPMIH
jgi:hypothetical protein